MSFVLPGNARSLRFTGEAKALGPVAETPKAGATALGKPRVRKPSKPVALGANPGATNTDLSAQAPPRNVVPGRVRTPVPANRVEIVPTPYPQQRGGRIARNSLDSVSDDPTTWMDRDDLL